MESAEYKDKSSQTNSPEEPGNSQPLSKVEAIELLNDSIDRLEATIKNLSQSSAHNLPSSESINTLIDTTKELADAVALPTEEAEVTVPQPQEPEQLETVEEIEAVEKEATSNQAVKAVEPPSPSNSPQTNPPSNSTVPPSQKQENRALTIIGVIAIVIAIVAVVWLWVLPKETPGSTSVELPTEIVITREPSIQPPTDETTPENSETSEPLVVDNTSQNSELISPETETVIVDNSIPQDLTSPGKTQNLKLTTIEPELTFTAEQTLIANLQTKLAELVASYDQDLFTQIQVNLPQNSLLVELTDHWYDLGESRQSKLANQILNRSRQLQFDKLELQDATGTLVARNPVVGEQIIILQSHKEP